MTAFDSPVPLLIRSENGEFLVDVSTAEDGLEIVLRALASVRSRYGERGNTNPR